MVTPNINGFVFKLHFPRDIRSLIVIFFFLNPAVNVVTSEDNGIWFRCQFSIIIVLWDFFDFDNNGMGRILISGSSF